MGPVLLALEKARGVRSLVCATGQHRELLADSLALFGIRPDFDFALMRRTQSPGTLLAALLTKLEPLIARVRPDWVVAVGDTTSATGAALAAAHQRVPFAHVEAGLRTGCKDDPFPEEGNRRVATALADLHFAPTAHARLNLRRENIPGRTIIVTGNPIIDTLRSVACRPEPSGLAPLLARLGLPATRGPDQPRLLVVTCHRRENLGRPLGQVCAAVRDLAERSEGDLKVLFILHPNPAMRALTQRALSRVPHVVCAAPLAYPEMIAVLRRAFVVLTDSGGLQEEAPWLRVPVLVLRDHTERPEGVAAGVARLCGTSRQGIVAAVQRMCDRPSARRTMATGFTGYGDGHAARRIVAGLISHYRGRIRSS